MILRPRALSILGGIAGLAAIAYAWAISLPLIADDYVQAMLAAQFAPVSGWRELAGDALYRCRSTSLFLTYWTMALFGVNRLAFNLTSLSLHIMNAWLVLALGSWKVIGWRVSTAAAVFFVIYETHQEAVVWYAALPEQLVFLFVLLCFLAWLRWLENGHPAWYIATGAAYLLALASKESAVLVLGLMLIPLIFRSERRRPLIAMIPFVAAALLYAWAIFAAGQSHLHLNDGTFSFRAPVLWNWFNSFVRMFWIWGLAGLILLWRLRAKEYLRLVWVAMAWTAIALIPYSFLMYMDRVPSRHRYLASIGISMIVAAAFIALKEWSSTARRPWLVPAAAAIVFLHNCGYLWLYKQPQFVKRAEPTEAVLELVREQNRPVVVHCYPYSIIVAQWAVQLVEHKPPGFVTPGPSLKSCNDRTILRTAGAEPATATGF